MRALALAVFGAAALGCGPVDSVAPRDRNGQAGAATLEPTLENLQTYIFDGACAMGSCHGMPTAAGGLDLSHADASYQNLVGAVVTNSVAHENAWLRVKPGEPGLSFLVRKLGGPGVGEGSPMPVGTSQLSGYYRALVEEWILGGAMR